MSEEGAYSRAALARPPTLPFAFEQRGPRCASKLAKRLDELQICPKPSVLVLRGGFATFGRIYKHEGDLVEAYDEAKAQWE